MAEVISAAPLSIAVDLGGHQPSLCVAGTVDHSNMSRLATVLGTLAEEQERCVSLDLDGIESIDTPALRTLAHSAGLFRDRKKRLHLKCASGPVQNLLDTLLLSDLFCVEEECSHRRGPHACGYATVDWEMDVFTLPSSIENCQQARTRVDRVAEALGYGESVRGDVMLAVGEAVANAIEHGNNGDEDGCFTVTCLATPERLCISVSDGGSGFCLDELPTLEEGMFLERGRGIHCMNAVMDEVSFRFHSGTTVRMVKER